jgi:hypothetical protein
MVMNERIRELAEQAKKYALDAMIKITDKEQALKVYSESYDTKFAELIVRKFIGILETEIELVEGYKSTACNDFDISWHEGKILHFTKLVEKSKKHFGVEE